MPTRSVDPLGVATRVPGSSFCAVVSLALSVCVVCLSSPLETAYETMRALAARAGRFGCVRGGHDRGLSASRWGCS